MSEKERQFANEIRVAAIGFALTAVISWVGFFFTGREKIGRLEEDMKKKADKELIEYQLQVIQDDVKEIKNSLPITR